MKAKSGLSEVVILSDDELNGYKKIILDKIASSEAIIKDLKGSFSNPNGTDDTSPSLIPDENDASGNSKESNSMLLLRQEKHLRDLKNAIVRIKNRTYGFCHVTGKRIPDERLKLVPHTTTTTEGKEIENQRKNNTRHFQTN